MEQKIGYVYMITSPSNRIYIGSTICIEQRWKTYRKSSCKTQPKLYNSFKKYGVKNHIFEIIWEGPLDEMLKHETIFGRKYDVLSPNNLNLALPKLGDAHTCISEETREKMRKANLGKKMSKESIERTRLANIGREVSQQQRDNHSKLMKGKKLSKTHIENRTKSQSISIIQTDLEGNFIKEWQSSASAERELGFCRSHIIKCCRKKLKSYKKFKWKYKNL